jgi:hypothetical protein
MEEVKANGSIPLHIASCIRHCTGLDGTLVENYDLTQLNPDERIQARLDRNNAPAEMVDRYAHQKAGGAIFPPIVVTLDSRIVDGNTRTKADRKREMRYAAAIIVPIDLTKEPDKERSLRLLSFMLNNVNGKALDKEERERYMCDMIEEDATDQDICWAVGFSSETVAKKRKELVAKARLDIVGVDTHLLKPSQLRKLGEGAIIALDDDSYRDLAQLAADADMSVSEVATIGTSLRQMESSETRQDRLTRERDARQQQIADHRRGAHVHPPMARQLRDSLGQLLQRAPDEAFVEKNPEYEEAHIEFLDRAIARLQVFKRLQEAHSSGGDMAFVSHPAASGDHPIAS